MKKNKKNKLISYLNYKDFLIIFGLWYFMAGFNTMTTEISFNNTRLTEIFHFLFILTGRFIYLALIIFYLISLYPVSFKEIGFNLRNMKDQFLKVISPLICLLLFVIILINIPLSFSKHPGFVPLYYIDNPQVFINSLLPFSLFFIANLFIALSELFLLTNFVFNLFKYIISNQTLSLLMSSLIYSVILLHFTPGRILINLLIALITLYLYLKTDSLFISSLFLAGYYSIYIVYIYGWSYIRF
jgi:hypothetical protein